MQSHEQDDTDVELHDINVTPFIDVILVLLIVFMVAAPLATVNIPVTLPALKEASQLNLKEPVYISINEDNQLFVGDQQVLKDKLLDVLYVQTQGNNETGIFFRVDRSVKYETLIEVMDLMRHAGYLKIALVGLASN